MNSDESKSQNGEDFQEFEEVNIPVPWGYISGIWWGPKSVQPIIAVHGWQDNAGSFLKLAPLISKDVSILSIDLPGHGHSSQFPPGKWWGPKQIQPILALHGRQDNSGSFDKLIPKLSKSISVLSIDLPGHGLSSHYPKGHYYYMHWDGLIVVRRIIKHYNWNKVRLLGHSLGGAISFLYAASYPNEVDFIISLDIVSPNVRDITKTVTVTGDHIDKFLKYEDLTLDSMPCYEYNEMIDIVEDAYKGSITRESAKILMKRGMQPALNPGKHYFRRDPRLKVSSLGMLSLDLIFAYAAEIKCGYLNIRAKPGLQSDQPENYQRVLDVIKKSARLFVYHEVEGTHHVHLDEPEKIAPIINDFIAMNKR